VVVSIAFCSSMAGTDAMSPTYQHSQVTA
jgi:hypothetical protein